MTSLLTVEAREWQQEDPQNNNFVRWTAPGQKEPFVFTGSFDHKGVDLSAAEVYAIQAQQVFGGALQWAAAWNKNPDHTPTWNICGIEFIGPVDGWQEEKGHNPGFPKGDGTRWHKFWGNGTAYLLKAA